MSYAYMLEKVDIFDELDKDRLERISSICVEHRYAEGDVVSAAACRYLMQNGL